MKICKGVVLPIISSQCFAPYENRRGVALLPPSSWPLNINGFNIRVLICLLDFKKSTKRWQSFKLSSKLTHSLSQQAAFPASIIMSGKYKLHLSLNIPHSFMIQPSKRCSIFLFLFLPKSFPQKRGGLNTDGWAFPQWKSYLKKPNVCQRKLITCCMFNHVQFINIVTVVNMYWHRQKHLETANKL